MPRETTKEEPADAPASVRQRARRAKFDDADPQHRLATADAHASSDETRDRRFRRVKATAERLAWVCGCAAVLYLLGFPEAVVQLWRGGSVLLRAAAGAWAVFGAVFLYVALYLPYRRGIVLRVETWAVDAPRAVQIGTAASIVGFSALTAGVWPQYSLLSPLVTVILGIGALNLVTLF